MSVLEMLTEEEAYLLAILTDPSGVDQAEFLWYAPDQDHYGCFRAWPFQRKWWRSSDQLQIDQCARSAGKSLSIQVRACAFPILHPSQEMVITAPEGNHLQAVTDLIETRLRHNRFYSELMLANASQGITHRPFLAKFRNDSRIMGRIPQRDGRGVKGVHPLWLEMDEAQDYPSAGWTEIVETLKQGNDAARWRAHGVTKGIRDEFWKFTQEGSDWNVHRYSAMWRPTWTDQERDEKINMYGSANHPDYRRNVLGKHGDVANPLFVLTRLMKCVDLDPASDYNENTYHKLQLNAEMVEDRGGEILNAIDLPMSHRKFKTTWAGMDVGYTTDPSEILVFSEDEKAPDGDDSLLRLVSRFRLQRISTTDQAKLVLWLFDFYNLNAFAMDKTGNGLPLFQLIQQQAETGGPMATRIVNKELIKGYNFSEKILVDFDQSIPIDDMGGDAVTDTGIKRNVLEYASDKLREYVDTRRLMMPDDRDLIQEFQGQTFTYDKGGMDMYGRRRFSKGSFHALDAARMAALAHAQYGIEAFMREYSKVKQAEPVYDIFVAP
jgi:hypothetical protein